MSTIQGTQHTLLMADAEIRHFQTQYPVVSRLLGGGFDSFYHKNAIRLATIYDKQNQLMEQCVKKDAEGRFIHIPAGEDKPNEVVWAFKDDIAKIKFETEMKNLMELTCTIYLK